MWGKMAKTVDAEAQEEEIRQIARYIHDHANCLFIDSPVTAMGVGPREVLDMKRISTNPAL